MNCGRTTVIRAQRFRRGRSVGGMPPGSRASAQPVSCAASCRSRGPGRGLSSRQDSSRRIGIRADDHGHSRGSSKVAVSVREIFGGARRDRTADLLNAIQALSQLSYDPTGGADRCRSAWASRTASGSLGLSRGSRRGAQEENSPPDAVSLPRRRRPRRPGRRATHCRPNRPRADRHRHPNPRSIPCRADRLRSRYRPRECRRPSRGSRAR